MISYQSSDDNEVKKVANFSDWPLAAFICLGIALYLILLVIVLLVRRCVVRKTGCSAACCTGGDSCSRLGLACAETCAPPPACVACAQNKTTCCTAPTCGCTDACTAIDQWCSGGGWCTGGGWCSGGDWCSGGGWCTDKNWCSGNGWCTGKDWCSVVECTSLDCLCCEITCKGKPAPSA
ncbi:keratin-associated protein 5-5-like [Hyalella azteca]|uniref:Keratin-associated protein 5-5-like n=1 Tax=Hyalella azteca TaxID=294128 RepID=A0A8B7PAQ3_HYAAZ|nr:keratin-associated protein 5-5-like [Hyalella azteca]